MQRSNSGVMQKIIEDMSDELSIQEIDTFLFILSKYTTLSKETLYQWSPSKIREFVLQHQNKLQQEIEAQNEKYYEYIKDIIIR